MSGEISENRIKKLKIGFGMERLPCGGGCIRLRVKW